MFQWPCHPTRSSRQDLYVHHHLGMGDMIHCNGLVRHLLEGIEKPHKVWVFCKGRYQEMARWMYRDEPRIRILPLADDNEECREVKRILRERQVPPTQFLSIGHRQFPRLSRQHPELYADQILYLHAGVPYEYRFSKCYWERDYAEEERVYDRLAPSGDYAFVHDDPARGFVIAADAIDLPIVRNDMSISIFHLGLLLERARQVHCMESSIRCMIESLDMSRVELFLHTFRGNPGKATCQNWHTTNAGTAFAVGPPTRRTIANKLARFARRTINRLAS